MTLLPAHFLFRFTLGCRRMPQIPKDSGPRLLDLPSLCRIDNFPELAGRKNFADVRTGWNEAGLGLQVEVRGKQQLPQGDAARPRGSDGVTFWIDTRDARNIHRAGRYCHQFYFLPTGGGPNHDEPAAGQLKINRALQDAPEVPPGRILFQSRRTRTGYVLEAFLPAAVLHGFDPEASPRLGFYYWVRDAELGDQTLGLGVEFPFWEDPSLWATLELQPG